MPMSALLARDVFVRLSGVEILHDVDLNVKEGQVVAILGANGSGKSTLVRTMLGIIPVSSGQVEVFGQPVGSGTPWADIGYVPQRIGAGRASRFRYAGGWPRACCMARRCGPGAPRRPPGGSGG